MTEDNVCNSGTSDRTLFFLLKRYHLAMLGFFYNTILGNLRARKLADHYGMPRSIILKEFDEYAVLARKEGLVPSIRGFEINLRQSISEIFPAVKNLEPLYCKGLDPLNPYQA